jgi:hypothetical protein
MSDLISMLEAAHIMIGARHYTRLRSVFGRMKDAPKPAKRGPGKKNWYDRREIIEYAENHDVIRLMNNAFTEMRNERSQKSQERERMTPVPLNTLHIKFLRGEFSRIDQQLAKLQMIKRSRMNRPKTTRISIGDRSA